MSIELQPINIDTCTFKTFPGQGFVWNVETVDRMKHVICYFGYEAEKYTEELPDPYYILLVQRHWVIGTDTHWAIEGPDEWRFHLHHNKNWLTQYTQPP